MLIMFLDTQKGKSFFPWVEKYIAASQSESSQSSLSSYTLKWALILQNTGGKGGTSLINSPSHQVQVFVGFEVLRTDIV